MFTQLSTGLLLSSHFHIGTAAATPDQYIIYDDQTGNLFYDRDGIGPAQKVLFAVLVGVVGTLDASDFTTTLPN